MLTFLIETLTTALHAVNAPLKGTLYLGSRWQYTGDDKALRLTGNNMETAISLTVRPVAADLDPLDISAPFVCAEWLSTLPADATVTLDYSPTTSRLIAQVGGDTATFACFPGENHPVLPDVGGDPLTLDSAQLRTALTAVLPAASSDPMQHILSGVYLKAAGNTLTLATADGFRLAEYQLPLAAPVVEDQTLILPAASLKELIKLLPKDSQEIALVWNSAQARFAWDDTVLCARRIDGTYPDYRRVIANAHESALNTAAINRAALIAAIKCAAVFARENAKILQVTLTGSDVRVRAEGVGIGDGAATLPLTAPAPEHEFFVNAKFFEDGAKALPGDTVTLHYGDAHQAVYLTYGDAPYVYVAMPMHVRE